MTWECCKSLENEGVKDTMIQDMTQGNPSKILVSYAMPIVLSGVFQQFYNVADSLIAGQFAGVNALAAVGASYPITMLFIAVATGAGMGGAVVISQLFGAKEYTRLKTAASTAVIAMLILALGLTVIGQIANNSLMRLMQTPQEVFVEGALYLRIYIAGLVFLFVYNIANAIFNGLGDSRTSLYFLIFSSVLNIVLDYVFVAHLHMGVAGVAWATFIAQGLASVLALAALVKRINSIKTEGEIRKFDKHVLKHMSKIAVPSILQQSTVSVGQLLVQALVNSYGAAVIAGYAAAIKLDSFLKMVISSMGNAISSYTAQNAGARKLHRVWDGFKVSAKLLTVYSLLAFGIARCFGTAMVGWFVGEGTDAATKLEVLKVGGTYMNVVTAFYLFFAFMMLGNGVLRGVGAMTGYTVATFVDLAIRVVGAYILAYIIGYNAIWWAIPIGWAVAAVMIALFLIKGNWKKAWE